MLVMMSLYLLYNISIGLTLIEILKIKILLIVNILTIICVINR